MMSYAQDPGATRRILPIRSATLGLAAGLLAAASGVQAAPSPGIVPLVASGQVGARSEEHTSELQSRENLVCRLLLEKKKTTKNSCVFHLSVNNMARDFNAV